MPLYTYNCDSCGGFRDWQSNTASDQSAPCPRCGTASQRAVTAPTILRMDPRKRNAATKRARTSLRWCGEKSASRRVPMDTLMVTLMAARTVSGRTSTRRHVPG